MFELLQMSLEIKKILYAADAKESAPAEAVGQSVDVEGVIDDNITEY